MDYDFVKDFKDEDFYQIFKSRQFVPFYSHEENKRIPRPQDDDYHSGDQYNGVIKKWMCTMILNVILDMNMI